MTLRRSLLTCLLCAVACGPTKKATRDDAPLAGPTPEIDAAAHAADRPDADKALDAGRKPLGFLTFMGVRRGERVADLGAGGGWTTELLSRVVGDKGVVYAQNAPKMIAIIGTKVTDALAARTQKNIVRVDREFDDPLPPEANNLDLVVMNIIYHDTVWLGVDRDRMNKAVFAALRPGGHYVIADSSAVDGSGTEACKTLHRIDRAVVRQEVLRAGFVLEAASPLYKNPEDTRDWNSSPRAAGEKRGTSDRFLLRFAKR
jgi:predicted methyltransferase